MAAVTNSPRVSHQECHSPRFDAEIPRSFICSISEEIMQNPAIIDCGHSFERESIEDWNKRNGTCPLDRASITHIIRNRDLEGFIQDWKRDHITEEIDSKSLASYILSPSKIPSPKEDRFNAYLRHVAAANITQEVADSIIQQSREITSQIPNFESHRSFQQISLRGNASVALERILTAARSRKDASEEAARQALSPRTSALLRFMENSQRTLEANQKSLQTTLEAVQNRLEAQERREEARDEKTRQKEREEDEKTQRLAQEQAQKEAQNQRPLTYTELASLGAQMLAPVAAIMLGRGLGGVMDNNQETSFGSEALRVDGTDVLAATEGVVNVAAAWANNGNAGIRRLSEQPSAALASNVLRQADRGYRDAIARDRMRESNGRLEYLEACERKRQKEAEEVDANKKTDNESGGFFSNLFGRKK